MVYLEDREFPWFLSLRCNLPEWGNSASWNGSQRGNEGESNRHRVRKLAVGGDKSRPKIIANKYWRCPGKKRPKKVGAFLNRDKPAPVWHSPEFYSQPHPEGAKRVRFFEQDGQRILHVDFSKAELPLIREVATECLRMNRAEPRNSVLSLVEVQEIPFDTDALKIGEELTGLCQEYALRTAVSGVVGFRSFLLETIAKASRRPIRLFKDREKAIEWLLKDGA